MINKMKRAIGVFALGYTLGLAVNSAQSQDIEFFMPVSGQEGESNYEKLRREDHNVFCADLKINIGYDVRDAKYLVEKLATISLDAIAHGNTAQVLSMVSEDFYHPSAGLETKVGSYFTGQKYSLVGPDLVQSYCQLVNPIVKNKEEDMFTETGFQYFPGDVAVFSQFPNSIDELGMVFRKKSGAGMPYKIVAANFEVLRSIEPHVADSL